MRNGEHHLLTEIRNYESPEPFIPGSLEKSCNFAYGPSDRLLRANRHYFPPMSSSDAMSPEETFCVDAYHAYSEAYNRELSRFYPKAYDETCSKLTPEQVQYEVGSELANGS